MSPLVLDMAQIRDAITGFLWPFFRISALFAILPVLGGSEVPVRVRVALAIVVTALVLPLLPPAPSLDPLSAGSLLVTLQEIVIGLAMGLMVLLVFNAVTLAGESIAITMGLGFALMNDPQNGVQVPTVSQFYVIFATLLFLSLDGHHAALALAVGSFDTLPIGAALGPDATWQLLSWAGDDVPRGARDRAASARGDADGQPPDGRDDPRRAADEHLLGRLSADVVDRLRRDRADAAGVRRVVRIAPRRGARRARAAYESLVVLLADSDVLSEPGRCGDKASSRRRAGALRAEITHDPQRPGSPAGNASERRILRCPSSPHSSAPSSERLVFDTPKRSEHVTVGEEDH